MTKDYCDNGSPYYPAGVTEKDIDGEDNWEALKIDLLAELDGIRYDIDCIVNYVKSDEEKNPDDADKLIKLLKKEKDLIRDLKEIDVDVD